MALNILLRGSEISASQVRRIEAAGMDIFIQLSGFRLKVIYKKKNKEISKLKHSRISDKIERCRRIWRRYIPRMHNNRIHRVTVGCPNSRKLLARYLYMMVMSNNMYVQMIL